RPGREDQVVIPERDALAIDGVDEDASLIAVEPCHLPEDHRGVALPSEDAANRRGDLPRAQDRRRDLIQERLKEMMVLTIDQQDVDIGVAEGLRGGQAAEATPYDHDVRRRITHGGPRSRPVRMTARRSPGGSAAGAGSIRAPT